MSDPLYRKLYSSPRMVADLLRAVAPEVARRLDFSTLEDVSAQYVGDRNQQRRGDKVWWVRLLDQRVDVLALLEFQSDKAAGVMPLRMLEYTALLLTDLNRKGELGSPGAWPIPLPVVLYNGAPAWTVPVEMRDLFAQVGTDLLPYVPSQRLLLVDELRARADDMPAGNLTRAVVGFEQSRSPADLLRVVQALDGWLDREEVELRRVFSDWIGEMEARMLPPGTAPGRAIGTLEDASMSLVERIGEWHKPWLEQGREEGFEQGRERGLEQGLGQGMEQGLEQGMERGLEQGLANERALLARQASSRFGGVAGDQVATALADVSDSERLGDVGEWIVTCATSEELRRRLAGLNGS